VRSGYARYDFQGVFQKLFTFATTDLSTIYFDVRKDTLYCDAENSVRRRAARTVLDIVFHHLTAWLAPVLVFTMEEVWLCRYPDTSVHLTDMPAVPNSWLNPALAEKWAHLRQVRRVITAALEVQRTAKVIGASLEAAPVVYITDPALFAATQGVAMTELVITSAIQITDRPAPEGAFTLSDVAGVAVVFDMAAGTKCQRCWQILPDVGTHAHAQTCARCNDALG
jgi:isoleucyl-tRNA synthetase